MKFKPLLTFLALLGVSVLLTGPAGASPSANGPTGLWNVPSAIAMPQDNYNLFLSDHNTENELIRFGANLGTGLETPLELGITTFDPEVGRSQTVFNLKFQATQETEKNPSVAVGAIDLTQEGDRTFYFAVTKRLDVPQPRKKPHPVFATVGAGTNKSNTVLDGIFFGITYLVSDTSAILLEYDAEDLNLGLRHHISPNAVFDVASVNNRLFLAFSFNAVR
jgi:hypothetical protein